MRMRTIRIWHVPRGTLRAENFLKKAWLLEIFGAGAPVVSQRLFPAGLHLVPREFGRKGVVFYDKIGAGAPVVEWRNERWCHLRRLYSAEPSMSSLFFRFGANSLNRQGLCAEASSKQIN